MIRKTGRQSAGYGRGYSLLVCSGQGSRFTLARPARAVQGVSSAAGTTSAQGSIMCTRRVVQCVRRSLR